MSFLGNLFKNKKNNSPDVLGRYPEYMQVKALPERRYLKTSRLIALFIFLNLAVMIALSGLFIYSANRVDVVVGGGRRGINVYSIDSSRKVLVPTEKDVHTVHSLQLYIEALLRKYIQNRHTITWDNNQMKLKWDVTGPVSAFSDYKQVYMPFRADADIYLTESRKKKFVRDVHLYELNPVTTTLWEAVLDIFDMPVPDEYAPICNCYDNSQTCIECKVNNAYKRERFRVIIRASFSGQKNLINPLGFIIHSYSMLYTPIHENEKYWGIPRDLKPNL